MNRTVLLLDDDLEIISIITFILEEANCIVVNSSVATYRCDIAEHQPDVILLDYWLGHALGSTICEELKADPKTANIPVILISAVNDVGNIAEKCKADDVLAKPFDIEELERKVLDWISKSD